MESLVTPDPSRITLTPAFRAISFSFQCPYEAAVWKRLVHVPDQAVQLLEQMSIVGQELVVAGAGGVGHGLHVATFVDTRIPTPRRERLGRVCPVCTAQSSRESGDRRRVEAAGEERSDGNVAPEPNRHRVGQELPEEVTRRSTVAFRWLRPVPRDRSVGPGGWRDPHEGAGGS